MAAALDAIVQSILEIQTAARRGDTGRRPVWPMIVLATPKGWTGPHIVDGHRIEGTFRAHQIPLAAPRTNPEHLRLLEGWMRSYRPDELFDADGPAAAGACGARAVRRRAYERQPTRQRRHPAAWI